MLADSDSEAVPLMLLVVDTPAFIEEGVVIIASSSNGFVAWLTPVRLYTVLEALELPTAISRPDGRLAEVGAESLALCR